MPTQLFDLFRDKYPIRTKQAMYPLVAFLIGLVLIQTGCGSGVAQPSSITSTSTVPSRTVTPVNTPTPQAKGAANSGPFVFHIMDIVSGAAAENAPEGSKAGDGWQSVIVRFEIESTSTDWVTWGLACGGLGQSIWDSDGFKHSARLITANISNCYVRFPPKSRLKFVTLGGVPATRTARKMDFFYKSEGRDITVMVELGTKSIDGPGFPISASINRGDKPLPITAECPRRARFTFGGIERQGKGGLAISLTIENLGGNYYRPSSRDFDVLVLSQNGRFTQTEIEFPPLGYQASSFGLAPGQKISGKLYVSLPGYMYAGATRDTTVPEENPISPFFVGISGPFGQQIPAKNAGDTPSCTQGMVSTVY